MAAAPPSPVRPRLPWLPWILVAFGALGLRGSAANERSLWLDEFHTRHHATAPDLGALHRGLLVDNHPPASFLATRISLAAAGDSPFGLRLPALLASLGAVALAALAARHLGGTPAALAAAVVVAGSGLQVITGSEARMYALLACAVAGVLEGLCARGSSTAGSPRPLPWRTGFWIAVGLHTHYWFLHHLLLWSAAAALALLLVRPRELRITARDLLPLALGGLAALPWYGFGFREQLTGHDLGPGGADPTWRDLAQSYLGLLFTRLGSLDPAPRLFLAAAGALLLAVGAAGLWHLLRSSEPGRRALGLLLGATAFGLGPLGFALAQALPRAGFNWNYLAGAVPALGVAIGIAVARGPRRIAGPATLGAALVLGAGAWPLVRGPGPEDLAGAVRHVLDAAAPGDGVLPVEWQPSFFPHGQAWDYYAAGQRADLVRLDHDAHYGLSLATGRELPATLHVVRRGLPLDAPLFVHLEQHYAERSSAPFGWGVSVETFRTRGQ
jgi:4-amino-4-deoxy-L-arabinose transferase-like glycosyltransferase